VLHFEGINRKKERGRPWTGIKTDGGGSATRITTTTKATTTKGNYRNINTIYQQRNGKKKK